MSDDESEFNERIDAMYQEERDALQAYFNSMNVKAPRRQESDETTSTSTSNYTYPGLNLLDDDLECCANNYESGNIHICPYYIVCRRHRRNLGSAAGRRKAAAWSPSDYCAGPWTWVAWTPAWLRRMSPRPSSAPLW